MVLCCKRLHNRQEVASPHTYVSTTPNVNKPSGVTTIGAGGAAAPGPTGIRGPRSSSKSTNNNNTIFHI